MSYQNLNHAYIMTFIHSADEASLVCLLSSRRVNKKEMVLVVGGVQWLTKSQLYEVKRIADRWVVLEINT